MTGTNHSRQEGGQPVSLEDFEHPRGTLVIVILFGALFGLAWLAMYVYGFLGRGAPHS